MVRYCTRQLSTTAFSVVFQQIPPYTFHLLGERGMRVEYNNSTCKKGDPKTLSSFNGQHSLGKIPTIRFIMKEQTLRRT